MRCSGLLMARTSSRPTGGNRWPPGSVAGHGEGSGGPRGLKRSCRRVLPHPPLACPVVPGLAVSPAGLEHAWSCCRRVIDPGTLLNPRPLAPGVRRTAWLERCADMGEIELPASLEITATYVDAELTMMLTRVSAGEDSRTVRAHANLAFAVLTGPN